MRSLHEPFQTASILSWLTIIWHQQWMWLVLMVLHTQRRRNTKLPWRSNWLYQTTYEAVAWWLLVQFAWAVSVYFYTIVSNYNDALALDFVLINDATHKKRVLTSELDPVMIEYRNDIRATDGIPEVEVYMSSTWMSWRGLSTKTFYITYVSHNYKLQMCPDEGFVDMAVTE